MVCFTQPHMFFFLVDFSFIISLHVVISLRPVQLSPVNYMDVSLNGGTPKSSILIGFSIINHPIWGTTILGNPHIIFKPCGMAMWSGRLHDAQFRHGCDRLEDSHGRFARHHESLGRRSNEKPGASFLAKLRCSTSSIFTAGSGAPFGGISIWMLWGQQQKTIFVSEQHGIHVEATWFKNWSLLLQG